MIRLTGNAQIKTLNFPDEIVKVAVEKRQGKDQMLNPKHGIKISNSIIIKAASSVERALAVHAPWGMLPSGLLHATPCDEGAVPL